jgi:hypothetical protein
VCCVCGVAVDRWRDYGICFFSNYIEAAMDAYQRDPPLIRATGLARVVSAAWAGQPATNVAWRDRDEAGFLLAACLQVEAAVSDFFLVEHWHSERDREARRQELNVSVTRANTLLATAGLGPVAKIPPSPTGPRFDVGARVVSGQYGPREGACAAGALTGGLAWLTAGDWLRRGRGAARAARRRPVRGPARLVQPQPQPQPRQRHR